MWEVWECGVTAFRNKTEFEKNGHNKLALTLKIDPEEFILENVCSIKNYDCCNDNCGQCCNLETLKIYWMLWRVWSEVKHTRWVCREKHYKKDEVVDSRDDVIIMFKEIATKSFKMHVYNIKCQYSVWNISKQI